MPANYSWRSGEVVEPYSLADKPRAKHFYYTAVAAPAVQPEIFFFSFLQEYPPDVIFPIASGHIELHSVLLSPRPARILLRAIMP